jgi:ferritin-like metal-binding protein YciE
MAANSLHELFVEDLRDIYDAEKRITKALPKLAKACSSRQLQQAFMTHLRETEGQIKRLERVFASIGEKARGKKCDGIMGLIEESNTHIEELDGPLLDAALTAGAQKVEHYEIASYGTLAYYADMMGHDEAKRLLGQTLDEEKATDEKLNQIAKSDVNRRALTEGDQDEDQESGMSFLGMGRGRRGSASAMSMAHDRADGRSGSRGGSRARKTTTGGRRSAGKKR